MPSGGREAAVVDTRLWSSTPFRNQTAWVDLTGQIQQFHIALAPKVFAMTGQNYALLPLGTTTRNPTWLGALQEQYTNASLALGLGPPPNLASYDLDDPTDFASWTFTLGQFSRRLAVTAGLE